jgi:heme exporter protein C
MDTHKSSLPVCIYWTVIAALFGAGVYIVAFLVPNEATMGPVQKIFYLHLPVAINTFVACTVTFVASLLYLWRRDSRWDDLASSSARVAVLLCTVVLITGMCWGRSAWGHWWTWSPRLTFSLVLWLLYVVYLVIRPSIPTRQRRALICAVYGTIAFLDVPLVYLSVRLMPDIHPQSIEMVPAMKLALLFWFVPVTALTVGLIAARFKLERRLSARINKTSPAATASSAAAIAQ